METTHDLDTPEGTVLAVYAYDGAVALRGSGKGERLSIEPRNVWSRLPEDVRAAISRHRAALKEMVRRDRLPERPDPTVAPPEIVAPRQPERAELTAAQREAAGLYIWNGVWTSALGDEYARDVLEGRIPFESAKAAHDYATRQAERIAQGGLRWTR